MVFFFIAKFQGLEGIFHKNYSLGSWGKRLFYSDFFNKYSKLFGRFPYNSFTTPPHSFFWSLKRLYQHFWYFFRNTLRILIYICPCFMGWFQFTRTGFHCIIFCAWWTISQDLSEQFFYQLILIHLINDILCFTIIGLLVLLQFYASSARVSLDNLTLSNAIQLELISIFFMTITFNIWYASVFNFIFDPFLRA